MNVNNINLYDWVSKCNDLSPLFPSYVGNPLFDHIVCPLNKGVVNGITYWVLLDGPNYIFRRFGGKDPYYGFKPILIITLSQAVLTKFIDLVFYGAKRTLETRSFKCISDKINAVSNWIDDETYQEFSKTHKYATDKLEEEELVKKGFLPELHRRIFYQELFKAITAIIVCKISNLIIKKMGYNSPQFSFVAIVGDSLFIDIIFQSLNLISAVSNTYQERLVKYK